MQTPDENYTTTKPRLLILEDPNLNSVHLLICNMEGKGNSLNISSYESNINIMFIVYRNTGCMDVKYLRISYWYGYSLQMFGFFKDISAY